MGAIHNKVEDEKAVIMLLELPDLARDWIGHHFRNSLQSVMIATQCDRKEMILKAVLHMLEDLNRIGC
jgi:hypothetical protein